MCHYISMNPQKSMKANFQSIRSYLKLNDQEPLPSHTIPSMDLLVWNCRGAGNKRFKRNLRELVQIHKPEIIVLLETKVKLTAICMFFNSMGFTTSTHVDPIGWSEGIWIFWKPSVVNVRVIEASSQQIIATISRQDYQDWLLSAIYASPIARQRDELWDHLEALAQNIKKPWLVAGDFNDFTSTSEK
ncbi:hypothetical protein ACSBR2_035097 [Camellia fascicularis]